MEMDEIIQQIDAEIARLQQARAALTTLGTADLGKKSGKSITQTTAPRKRRRLSPEGRARIAAAQKRRWAEQAREKK